ncbi:hypothetical protein BO443_30324 [Burkholderia orbicola]
MGRRHPEPLAGTAFAGHCRRTDLTRAPGALFAQTSLRSFDPLPAAQRPAVEAVLLSATVKQLLRTSVHSIGTGCSGHGALCQCRRSGKAVQICLQQRSISRGIP